ncbi:hypothetical protein ET445_03580 [Agromyces protaetiae]|uniref:RNA polymerase subunit sigma n=1 Tax=Agromyces protaetiae TaxID=2509455 RepID=A0A4P6F9I7_9MICO|nr:hypothetical protein [Agromyces protaetiae]QAY72562.1 hypothetical protein ET445_03580 [Agromyces protaetiae]
MSREGVASRLLAALRAADDVAYAALVSASVRMVVDSGDAAGGVAAGRAQTAHVFAALLSRHPDASLDTAEANGAPALVLRRPDREAVAVVGLDVDQAGSITAMWVQTAPDKLARWNRHRTPGPSV